MDKLGATHQINAFFALLLVGVGNEDLRNASAPSPRAGHGSSSTSTKQAPRSDAVGHTATVNQCHKTRALPLHLPLATGQLHYILVGFAASVFEQSAGLSTHCAQQIQTTAGDSNDGPLLQTQAGNCIMDCLKIASGHSNDVWKSGR